MTYKTLKTQLLTNHKTCPENKKLFKDCIAKHEYKLKRINGLSELDEGCIRTLMQDIQRFNNVNSWFNNKPLKQITKADLKRVYDGLEDGTIKTKKGKPFKDKQSYYAKIFPGLFF